MVNLPYGKMALSILGLLLVAIVLPSLHPGCEACPETPINITASLKPGWKHTITSPGFPGNYPKNITCLWRITGPRGYSLYLILEHFEIEPSRDCGSDYLLTASSEWRARWRNRGQCSILSNNYIHSLSPGQLILNDKLAYYESDVMWVKFSSDATSSFKGFKGEVRLVAPSAGNCNNYLNGSSGSFTSPKYPSKYPAGLSCTWHVSVPDGLKVKLTFTAFTLENTKNTHDDCINDYVEIREGVWGRFGQILGRFCGDDIPPAVTSTTNQMWVRFISDGNSSSIFSGFEAQFSGASEMISFSLLVLWLALMTSRSLY